MEITRLTSPFEWESTAADVISGIDLTGTRTVVTGGSSGIGVETARALAVAGAEVTLAVRNIDTGRQVAAEITARTGNHAVLVAPLDLSEQASVAAFVCEWDGPLDVLINNAGVMASPLSRTREGWESQFATNYLGHFALTTGLHEALRQAGHARVVSVSSVGHLGSDIDYDDIDFLRRPYDPQVAYSQSKTATVLFAVEANRRWQQDGITVNAVHPGPVLATNLTRHYDPIVLEKMLSSSAWRVKTTEQGAATSVFVATSPLLEGVGGRYFEDSNEAEPGEPGGRSGVAAYALDPKNATHLWQVTLEKFQAAGLDL
jgi:NAD(P)-dependent dehydrogenase (short-subunit alcohol dehydrogenase family)